MYLDVTFFFANTYDAPEGINGKRACFVSRRGDSVAAQKWFVGGALLSEQRKKSFYCDIKITEGTNTKDEMDRFVRDAFHGLEKILGDVHSDSYIYVEEVHGFAYGYGGITQERCYIAKNPARELQPA